MELHAKQRAYLDIQVDELLRPRHMAERLPHLFTPIRKLRSDLMDASEEALDMARKCGLKTP